jgi:hypothetical protein
MATVKPSIRLQVDQSAAPVHPCPPEPLQFPASVPIQAASRTYADALKMVRVGDAYSPHTACWIEEDGPGDGPDFHIPPGSPPGFDPGFDPGGGDEPLGTKQGGGDVVPAHPTIRPGSGGSPIPGGDDFPTGGDIGGEVMPGCTDPRATNFNPLATIDDGSCKYPPTPEDIYGCTDPKADNYDPLATIDDGSCEYPPNFGCTDPRAINYDPEATVDDGSCEYLGCTDPLALNYDPLATVDDGSCKYPPIQSSRVVDPPPGETEICCTHNPIALVGSARVFIEDTPFNPNPTRGAHRGAKGLFKGDALSCGDIAGFSPSRVLIG